MNKKRLFNNNSNNNKINNNNNNNLLVKRYNMIWNNIIKIYKEVRFISKIKKRKINKTTYFILLFFFAELIRLS